ncbi:MAG: thiamine phosphate synthase [Myxococcales bacterium]|nr:thiamine phosphate synthase [Myxococcales bacterium]
MTAPFGVVAITDPGLPDWIELATQAIQAGVPWLQLRAHPISRDDRLRAAQLLAPACAQSRTRLLINGDLEIAIAVSAAGLHLPRSAPPATTLRRRAVALGRSETLTIVRSCHYLDQLTDAHQEGADAATLSPIFPPGSKPDDTRPTLGVSKLADACARAPLPVIALGGITPARVAACRRAGAAGVATISGVFGDPEDVPRATEALCRAWELAV